MKHIRNCLICYQKFESNGPKSKYCGTECARRAMNESKRAKRREKREAEKAAKRPKMKSLAIINAEARAAGMTYGQYVAIKGI